MQAKSFQATDLTDLEKQIISAQSDGYSPTLALIFSAIDIGLPAVVELFKKYKIDIVGCSTSGEISNSACFENAAVGLFFDLDRALYRIHAVSTTEKSLYSACFETGKIVNETFKNPAVLLLSGGVSIDAEQLVYGLRDGVGREIPFFGGQAGDNMRLEATYAFSNDVMTSNGIACLILDNDRVEVRGLATSGWESIGDLNTITRAEGNIVYEINGERALDVFLKYFGFFSNAVDANNDFGSVSAQYPMQIERENGISVLRTPLFVKEEEGALILGGAVREGEKFRFSISPGFEVIEKTVNQFGDLAQKVQDPDAVVLFSCKGRHFALGPLLEEEVEGLYKHWNAPMAGFLTYGEIGTPDGGVCEFHNETCSLVLLKERLN